MLCLVTHCMITVYCLHSILQNYHHHFHYVLWCYSAALHTKGALKIGNFIYPVVTGESKELQVAAANFNRSLHQLNNQAANSMFLCLHNVHEWQIEGLGTEVGYGFDFAECLKFDL